MSILVTGGAGYVGSHCVAILKERGFEPIALDNLSKGHAQAVQGERLYVGDISDAELLDKIFTENKIDTVMHFAAFSLVEESMSNPAGYYKNNVGGTLALLEAMIRHNIKNIVFSSTAATYGIPVHNTVTETDPQCPINVYGQTKLTVEQMLRWFDCAYGLKHVSLRYFNVAGAHKSGNIGEDHTPETHLIPLILSVANGQNDKITIYGDNYRTPDKSNIRDYIHIEDLINAHIKAMVYLKNNNPSNSFNLGSANGYSNFEILDSARRVTNHPIPNVIGSRRAGDPDILIASSEKANKILSWTCEYTNIDDIIKSAWKWHQSHPHGYCDKH